MAFMLYLVFITLALIAKCEAKFEPFITGGQFARIEDFPHAVFLSMKINTRQWICGASVVNQRMLLTAAHCFQECAESADEETTPCEIYAYAGSANLETMQVIRSVEAYRCHEHYEDTYAENDVALAMVQGLPLGQGLPIKRVMLMRSFPHDLKDIHVSGWGVIDDTTRETSLMLKSVKQWILPREVCERAAPVVLHPGTMCAGSSGSTDGPASGDSGSALVMASHQQIGLVSYKSTIQDYTGYISKTRQTRRNYPQNILYYTNMSFYYDWIEQNAVDLYNLHC